MLYAVIDKLEFYGDQANQIRIEKLTESLDEAKQLLENLNSENYHLTHNQAAGYYKITEAEELSDYHTWADLQEWDGCPIENPTCDEDHQTNYDWAEEKAYNSGVDMYAQDQDGNHYKLTEI